MCHNRGQEPLEREKASPFQSALFAPPLLAIVLIVLVVLVLLATALSCMGVLGLNVIGTGVTGLGLCALVVSDLIPYWRREDNKNREEQRSEFDNINPDSRELKRGLHWRKTILFAKISSRERERRESEAKQIWEDAQRRADQEREEARETAARDDFLLFGHVGVIFGAVLFGAAYILPLLNVPWLESRDSEIVDPEHSSIEAPESSDTPVGP